MRLALSVVVNLIAILAPVSLAFTEAELRSVEDKREAQVRALRDAEMVQISATLNTRLPENRRADLFLRLAELHTEAYRAEFLLEGRVHERNVAKGIASRLDRSQSRKHLAPGLAACEEILKLRIPYPQMDRVYYFLGFNSKELGRESDASRYYRQLTGQFPRSPWTAEAHRELGDSEFSAGRYQQALTHLEAASRHLESSSLPLVLHKLAWTYYRLRQTERAVTTLKEAVRLSVANQQKYVSVRDEALRDMAVFMAEQGKVEEAIQYFETATGSKDYLPDVLTRLAAEYERNVKYDQAARVLEQILKLSPSTRAETLLALMRMDHRRGRILEALVRVKDVDLAQAEYANLKALIRATGTDQHAKFRKDGSRVSLKIAEAYYQRYLSTMASEPAAGEKAEIQMYLAEIRAARGDKAGALALYREVVAGRDPKYRSQAASNWVAAAKGADFVKAADELTALDPNSPESREARLRSAEMLAGKNSDKPKALERAEALAKEAPDSPQGVVAARLWLQLLGDQRPRSSENIHRAIEWIKSEPRLLSQDAKTGQKLQTQMQALSDQVAHDLIVYYEKTNDLARAAQAYEAYAHRTRDPKAAAHAYEGAILDYIKSDDYDRAEHVLKQWIQRRELPSRTKDAAISLGTLLFIEGRFDRVAEYFSAMGAEFQDAQFYETSARTFSALQRSREAFEAWVKASTLSGSGSSAQSRAWYKAGQIEESQGRWNEASKFYRNCLQSRSELRGACGIGLASLFERSKNWDQVQLTYRAVSDDADPRVSSLARLRLAELMERQADLPKLALPEKVLSNALSQRLKMLEQLTGAYELAAKKNGFWGVTALLRLARWTESFASEVDSLQPASGSSKSAEFQFKQTTRGISAPLRKKSKDLRVRAYRLALDGELLSPDIPEIVDSLSLRESAPFRAQGSRSRYRVAGIPPNGGDAGLNASLVTARAKLRDGYLTEKKAIDPEPWVNYGNLLWGLEKPELAAIAYDQALRIRPKDPWALTNKAVVLLSGSGQENWMHVAEARALLGQALTADAFFVTAKINLALLYNYYRLFERARPLWEQILARNKTTDLLDGSAIALFGTGRFAQAEELFSQSGAQGAPEGRFARLFHQASRSLIDKRGTRDECLTLLSRIDSDAVGGFERESVERLRADCRRLNEGGG